jgi:hypothetical protein
MDIQFVVIGIWLIPFEDSLRQSIHIMNCIRGQKRTGTSDIDAGDLENREWQRIATTMTAVPIGSNENDANNGF